MSDVQESVHFVKYKRGENQLVIFADETNPRWITCTTVLDYDSIAFADKFGNVGVVREKYLEPFLPSYTPPN